MRVPTMKNYMMRFETAADYLDMSDDSFLESVAPFLDTITIEETPYVLRADVELLVQMFFRSPGKDNVVKLHPVP